MSTGVGSIRMSLAIIVALALILGTPPIAQAVPGDLYLSAGSHSKEPAAPAVTCDHWNLAADFRTWPDQENPNRDSCGNSGVWHFMRSDSLARDPESYSLLPAFNPAADGIWGLNQWHRSPLAGPGYPLPAVAINATGVTQYPYSYTWPAGVVNLHPYENEMAIVGWQAPIAGAVSISGTVGDLDPGGNDGVTWAIDTQSVELAAGTVSGSSQTFNVSATVQPGDFVYFSIGPGPNGDFYSDSTQLDVRITPASDSDRKLFIPLIINQRTPNLPPVLASPGDENWSDEFGPPWLNAPVMALADDGAGGVYLGGGFTGNFSYIAHWDGQQPRSLGSGLNGWVRALAADSAGNVYAGGSFTTAGGVGAQYIARWDGSAWHPLGAGLDGDVFALATDAAGNVYAGGFFTTAGGGLASNIARWDRTAWYPLGAGVNATVLALAVDPAGTLYAGGAFTQAGGATANNVARWDGTTWAPLGSGMQGATSPYVYALALDAAGHLVAGGAFTQAGGTSALGIARWNGSTWSGLGAGLAGGPVRALAVTEKGEVLAGGSFTEAGRLAASRVARWSGGRWHALGKGVDGTVHVVAPAQVSGQVYAGGSFTSPRFFTRWDGVGWQAYGAGLASAATSSCVPAGLGLFSAPGGDLYVGGYFDHAGGIAANGIARWDDASWSPLSGLAPGVYSLVMDSAGILYVSGDFPTTIGGTTFNYIARWNGLAWSPLGSGLPYASELAFDPTGTLYVGGGMTTPHHGWVARWNGATWQPIGAGGWNHMNNVVFSMAIDSAGGLYAGGDFTMAGGQPVRYLAKWDGATGQQLGDIGHRVFGLHFDPAGNLWAVGDTIIARWDGASWLTVGATQYAWDVVGDRAGHAYVTGQFDAINGTPVSNIGMWDGTAWRPLGSGITPSGWCLYPYQPAGLDLALDGKGNLFVVGWHNTAGSRPSSAISRWTASDSRQVTGPGSYTLYVDNLPVTIHVKQQGTLHYLYAQRHDKSYPSADPSLDTGYFWEIVGAAAAGNPATGYTVDLTLSTAFNPDASDRVCQIQGSTWECAATLLAEYSVMRTDVTNLSSLWAVQDNHFEHLFPDWSRQHLRTTSRLERFNPLSVSN